MQEFLLLCTPRGELSPRRLLDATADLPFLAALLQGGGGVRLLSPRSKEHWTVPLQTRRGPHGPLEVLVPEGHRSHLEGPGAVPNWLYLAEPCASALVLGERGYRSATPAECALTPTMPPDAARTTPSSEPSWSFRRDVRPHLFVEQRAREGNYCRVTSGPLPSAPNAWLNPVLLHVRLDGDALSPLTARWAGPAALDSRPSSILRRLFEHHAPSWLIPGFGWRQDVRFRAWSSLLLGRDHRSAVQHLLLGGGSLGDSALDALGLERRLAAFLALDSLSGAASIRAHGVPGELTTFGFHLSEARPPGNRVWFAEQLTCAWAAGASLHELPGAPSSRCVGARAPAAFVVGSPEELEGMRANQAPDASRLATGLPELRRVSLPRARDLASLSRALLSRRARFGDPVLEFFADLLEDLARCALPAPERLSARVVGELRDEEAAVDLGALKAALARSLVLPDSPTLVQVPPHGGVEPCTIDLRSTAPQPERHWVFGWLQAGGVERPDAPGRRLRLPRASYWWNTWYDSLFLSPVDVTLDFRARGFVVGASRVDRGRLSPEAEGTAAWRRTDLGLAALGRRLLAHDESVSISSVADCHPPTA